MRGLRAITIGLAVGLGQAAVWGAPPDTAPPAEPDPQTKPKPAAKVPPTEYLKAGARLFNKGDLKLASKYLKAAQRYRGDLAPQEQVVLDTYLEELERFARKASQPPADNAVAPASMTLTTPAPKEPEAAPAARAADSFDTTALRTPSRYATTSPKQRARWFLQEAREFIRMGKFEEAARKVADAKALDVTWGRLEDSPEKVVKAIDYAREKASQTRRTPSARPLGIRLLEAVSPPAPASAGTEAGASDPDRTPGS